jgi:hypothetical protein
MRNASRRGGKRLGGSLLSARANKVSGPGRVSVALAGLDQFAGIGTEQHQPHVGQPGGTPALAKAATASRRPPTGFGVSDPTRARSIRAYGAGRHTRKLSVFRPLIGWRFRALHTAPARRSG